MRSRENQILSLWYNIRKAQTLLNDAHDRIVASLVITRKPGDLDEADCDMILDYIARLQAQINDSIFPSLRRLREGAGKNETEKSEQTDVASS